MDRRLLFVHAHPDDEASKGSATAARYVDEGARVTLVTCTGGEAGEVLNPAAGEIPSDQMGAIRAKELAAAVAAIGFDHAYQLGFVDSGYHEDPDGVPEGTFARTPVDIPAKRLARILRAERPQVVVTYPEDGGYPHPDHIMTYEVTIRALELAEDADADLSEDDAPDGLPPADAAPWRVSKVYAATIFPAERVLALHQALQERGLDSPYEGWLERRAERGVPASPEALIEVADWLDRRDAALLAHVTQIDPNGFWFQVPRDLERRVYPYEGYIVLRSDVEVVAPEADLFAGLSE